MSYTRMVLPSYNTATPYREIERDEIEYTYCHDYSHLSRYRNLRQVIHEGTSESRYIALETFNTLKTQSEVYYYTVPSRLANRLDVIAHEQLGSASYAWVIAYFNDIEDGYTVPSGATIKIPKSISLLFNEGEVLASVSAVKLNLGSE